MPEACVMTRSAAVAAALAALATLWSAAPASAQFYKGKTLTLIVNFQVTAIGRLPKPATKRFDSATPAPRETWQDTPSETRQAYFSAADAYDVPVLRRDNLQPGARIAGPGVIEEQTSTIVLYPGQRAVVDAYLNIEVEVQS